MALRHGIRSLLGLARHAPAAGGHMLPPAAVPVAQQLASGCRWSSSTVVDVDRSGIDKDFMAAFRVHNSSLPDLQGMVVHGSVVMATKDWVTVQVGMKKNYRFKARELRLADVVSRGGSKPVGDPDDRVQVGDEINFLIEQLEAPDGEALLSASKHTRAAHFNSVWAEIKKYEGTREPIQGRILNAVNAGYSVGIAGYVAFMPLSCCSEQVARKIGTLQPFIVMKCKDETRNIVVGEWSPRGGVRRYTPFGQGGRGGGRGGGARGGRRGAALGPRRRRRRRRRRARHGGSAEDRGPARLGAAQAGGPGPGLGRIE